METNVIPLHEMNDTVLGKAAKDAREALVMVDTHGKAEVEAWIAYGAALNLGRAQFPSNEEFGKWKVLEKLDFFVSANLAKTTVHPKDAEAAMWAAENPEELALAQAMPGSTRTLRGWHALWKSHVNAGNLDAALDYYLKERQREIFEVIAKAGPEGISRETLIATGDPDWAAGKHIDTNMAPLFTKGFVAPIGPGLFVAAGQPGGPSFPPAPVAKPTKAKAPAKPKAAGTAKKAPTAKPAATKGKAGGPKAPPIKAVGKPKKVLTREQVDPEFVGDALAFAQEYGHVWLQTAEERATSRFGGVAMMFRYLVKEIARLTPSTPGVDLNWLRSPKAEDVAKLEEAVEVMDATLTKAKAALTKAKAELAKKVEA